MGASDCNFYGKVAFRGMWERRRRVTSYKREGENVSAGAEQQ